MIGELHIYKASITGHFFQYSGEMASEENNYGRKYERGKTLSKDMRRLILKDITELGGNPMLLHPPHGVRKTVACKYKVSPSTVSRLWKTYLTSDLLTPSKDLSRFGINRKLQKDDLQFMELMKSNHPTMTHGELKDKLLEVSPNPDADVHLSTISRSIRRRLSSGPWSRKKVNTVNINKFTPANLAYTQEYINFMWQQDPHSVKFMDESGIEISCASRRSYGHAPVGQKCIDIVKNNQQPNKTINLLVGLDGIFCTVFDGTSNTERYLNFFHQAIHATTSTGIPVLPPEMLSLLTMYLAITMKQKESCIHGLQVSECNTHSLHLTTQTLIQ